MSDIKLNTTTHDILIDINTPVLTNERDTIDQKVKIELLFLFSEYFLDTTLGVPYIERIAIKNPELAQIEALIRNVILSVNNVISIEKLVIDFDRPARLLTIDCTYTTIYSSINLTQDIII